MALLLGITVIGAVLTNRQTASLDAGNNPVAAFLSGYRWGLVVAAVLVAAGGNAAFLALRGQHPRTEAEVIAAQAALERPLIGQAAVPADSRA